MTERYEPRPPRATSETRRRAMRKAIDAYDSPAQSANRKHVHDHVRMMLRVKYLPEFKELQRGQEKVDPFGNPIPWRTQYARALTELMYLHSAEADELRSAIWEELRNAE